jgi:crotonobetainyl-CoA:carnitine CoA-transferase CaiB-like acyl-CoA transferase
VSDHEASGSPRPGRASFLDGLRVLELGDGIAGSATSSVLMALGADVTTVADRASPHRRARPQPPTGGRPENLLSIILDREKRLIWAADLDVAGITGLVTRGTGRTAPFDLVIVDRVGGVRGPLLGLADVAEYASFVARFNPGAWVSISAFGLSGERCGDIATELTLAAASGMLRSVRDPGTARPLKLAGYQSLLNTAQAAALACCQAVDLARDGDPVHLDLSAMEATIAMGPTLEAAAVLLNADGPGGARRYGAPASFYTCLDGIIRISAMEDHQWRGVVAAMGSPAWTEPFATAESRIEGHEDIDRRIGAWTAALTKAEAETLLQSHGVPATAMYSPAETLSSPQLQHRGSLESVPVPGGPELRIVGAQYRAIDGEARAEAGRRRRSLRGLKVLEASHVLAAPLAGALLGALGAEVTKLEDLKRIDMYRRRGPYIDGIGGSERSCYFALVNHSKASAAFDVEAGRDRLESLLHDADVVMENLGGKRAARLGLAVAELVKHHPLALAVSSSGFGQDGPFAAYRAYAYNLQASCCLGFLTRNSDGEPAEIDLPWADLVSGYALATIVAAWAIGPAGNAGTGVDFAMADLIIAHFNEFVAAASLDPESDSLVDRANEMFPYAPNGVYATEGGGWIALSVDGDEQYARLTKILCHEPLCHLDFGTSVARFEHRQVLDRLVEDATSRRNASILARDLRAAGIVAEELVGPRDLPTVPQLVSRGFFTPVEHPEWGRRPLIGIPWRPFGQPPIALGAPPLLEPDEGGDGGPAS